MGMQSLQTVALWQKPGSLPTSAAPKAFTASTTWTCPWSGRWSVTCIGGGGKGAAYSKRTSAQGTASSTDYTHLYNGGAGGGAGYVVTKTVTLTKGTAYAVVVGAAAGNSSFGGSLVTASKGANASATTGGAGGGKGGNANGSWTQISANCLHRVYKSTGTGTGIGNSESHSGTTTVTVLKSATYHYKYGANGAGGSNGTSYGKGGNGGKATNVAPPTHSYGVTASSYNGAMTGANFHTTADDPSSTTAPSNGAAGRVTLYYVGP